MKSIFGQNLFRLNESAFLRLDEKEFTVQPRNTNYSKDWHGDRDISPAEADHLFDVFHDSYTKSVGSSHDRDWFDRRAPNWIFYGTIDAGVAARLQHPQVDELDDKGNPTGNKKSVDLWRFTASYGNLPGVIKGAKEFEAAHGDEAVWAVLTPGLAKLITRKSEGKFFQAPKPFVKMLYPVLTQNGGNYLAQQIRCDDDGTLLAQTPEGKEIEKVVVLNKAYVSAFYPQYAEVIEDVIQNPDDPLTSKLFEIYAEAIKTGNFKKAKEDAVNEVAGHIFGLAWQTGLLQDTMDKADKFLGHIDRDVEAAKRGWESIDPDSRRAIKRMGIKALRSASPETRDWLKKNYSDLNVLWKMMHDPDYVEPPPVRDPFNPEPTIDDYSMNRPEKGVPPGPDERE